MVSARLWACWEALWAGVLIACPIAAARTRPDKERQPWTCSWRSNFNALFTLATFKGLLTPSHRLLAALEWLKGLGLCHSAKDHTNNSLSCACLVRVSPRLRTWLYWRAVPTYATASSFPLATLFSLVNLIFIAAHWVPLYQDRLEQCISKFPVVWAWSV